MSTPGFDALMLPRLLLLGNGGHEGTRNVTSSYVWSPSSWARHRSTYVPGSLRDRYHPSVVPGGSVLKVALVSYTESDSTGRTALDQDEAVAVMLEKYEVCCGTAGHSATLGSVLGSLTVVPRVSFRLLFSGFSETLAT